MGLYLGLDTSNYTTSAALYDSISHTVVQEKKLLPVHSGAVGLRQSDAVFSHVKQLSEVVNGLCKNGGHTLAGVCVSTRPRSVDGSYMPCFLVGKLVAESLCSITGIPLVECSHQEGHIMAALYSADKLEWIDKATYFYAFHVSGGTTEVLLVRPNNELFDATLVAKTLDLNAGQLIDRTGVLLGLPFPCGSHLDKLSLECTEKISPLPRASICKSKKGLDFHLSGVQNQVERLHSNGASPAYIARFVLEAVGVTLTSVTKLLLATMGEKPILYAGGVMSNTLLRQKLSEGFDAHFAMPSFSTDNAAGTAIIGARAFSSTP